MNITELCYLDRVSYKGKPIVVCGINGTFNEVTDENMNNYDASVLEPIPLTREMLLLNGFTDKGAFVEMIFGGSCIRWFESGVLYYSKVYEKNNDDWRIHVRYVHEFLYVLKRVGLAEMVRNFRTK
jgi:hypothetical protein